MTAPLLLTRPCKIDFLKVAAIYLIFVSPLCAKESQLTVAEALVHYTFEIAMQVTWPNDAKMDQFIIGIVGPDPELEKAFEKRKSTIVRGKSLKIEFLGNTSFNPDNYSILFITKTSRARNNEIFPEINHTLIVTEGKVNNDKQMISLTPSFRKIEIELNRENLLLHRFEVSVNLLGLAGTKKDLTKKLREGEASLTQLLKEKKIEEDKLKTLTLLLNEKTELLILAKKEIYDDEKILENDNLRMLALSKQIEDSKNQIDNNHHEILQQQLLLNKSQLESDAKEKEIDTLQRGIEKNLLVLENQEIRINTQNNIMENKDQTIGAQQGWLIVTVAVIVMFFFMTFSLLKINILRMNANKSLEKLNSKLYELATTDEMTKLFNRRHFLETTQGELMRQHRQEGQEGHCAIIMIDIDHFKQVNDNYGHAAGDKVITKVAKFLKNSSRTYDITGRLGGEEFAMMMVDCDFLAASDIAQRLCREIEKEEIDVDEHTIKITISIGLSMLSDDDSSIEQVILRADKALYKAKEQGRNRVITAIE